MNLLESILAISDTCAKTTYTCYYRRRCYLFFKILLCVLVQYSNNHPAINQLSNVFQGKSDAMAAMSVEGLRNPAVPKIYESMAAPRQDYHL